MSAPVEAKRDRNHSGGTDSLPKDTIPRIPLNLRAHKTIIAIPWAILIFVSGILPEIGYFSLRYATTLKVQYILSIFTPIFGVVSLYSFTVRTVRLARKTSTCRPLGSTSNWALDYFDWNFALGFCVVSVVIAVGIAKNPSDVRIVSLPLAVLLLQVCGQMVLIIPLRAIGMRTPIRISSLAKGEPLRPAVFTIVEDVVAVDGEQGQAFREVWKARYDASAQFQLLLARLDWLWGVTGVIVAGGIFAAAFAPKTDAVGWALGWSVPWVWAGIMVVVTIQMTKSTCRQENAMLSEVNP